MNVMQKGIITLLKSALTQASLPLPDGFDLSGTEELVKKHHMSALVYDGAVRCGISRKEPVMQQLFQRYCRALLKSEKQMAALEQVFAAFDQECIDYMPLKGSKMKALYPKPELRTMSDADVLIRIEQNEKIAPVLEQLGFSQKAETDHEIVYSSDKLLLELHKRLIPSYNRDFHTYFADSWRCAKVRQGSRYDMSPEDEFLFNFTHFAKHYRDGGIGCRYVADLWVFLQAHPQMDEAYLNRELGKLQLLAFYRNIRRVIDVWFCDEPSDEKTDFITDFVFASGSWGERATGAISMGVRSTKKPGNTGRNKAAYLSGVLFPSCKELEGKYTVLKKAPWLLPAVWVYRPVYKVLFERKTVKRYMDNMELLTPENLKTRQQALRYVGLDYNF